ncbi:hypothetical protein AB0C14_03065 [Microbispora hainanensis]|uniref:hypothetical protein n=1 Tax=Microbispora hainanensis TaxID=568844 RepID=UPI0033FB72DB
MALEILTYLFAGCGLGSMVLAARAVPSVPGALVRRRPLVWGSALLVGGCATMALAAWSTREDVHYDDFGSAMTLLVAVDRRPGRRPARARGGRRRPGPCCARATFRRPVTLTACRG